MVLPQWNNSGPNQYDYAINGVPFLAGTDDNNPYVRQSVKVNKDQIDTTKEPGEQSLQGWWYRSQSSFDLGAGIKFMDPVKDPNLSRRFADSCGVDVFDAGQVTLLRKATRVSLSGGTADSGKHYAVGFANDGVEGVLTSNGSTLNKALSTGTVSSVTWGNAQSILDLASDGGSYYVACAAGIYRGTLPSGTGTKIYTHPTGITRSKIGYAKQRLAVLANQYFYAVPTTPSATPTALLTKHSSLLTQAELTNGNLGYTFAHPNSDWTWTATADGPAAMYLAGYSGDFSAIYATRVDPNSNALVPDLLTPYLVAEMPRGEQVLSMESYLGTYLIVGTNLGVRVAIIDGNGNLVMGPLSLESDTAVTSLMALGNFVWASGSSCDGHTGLYRLDLSKTVGDNNTLQFPYARDIYLDGDTFNTSKVSQAIVPIGYSGRVAFTVEGVGLVFESATDKVASGWLETGRIRLDTAEDKIFQYLRVSNLSVNGNITVAWRSEAGTLSTLYTYATDTIRTADIEASDAAPHPWVSYRFTLTRGAASTANSPALLSYQVKAQPANIKQRIIRLTLLCMQREGHHGKIIERPVWDRIKMLEQAEETGSVVRFQDMGTGENRYCIIDQIQFTATSAPETRSAQANPGGIILLTLRTVSPTT